LLGILLLFLLLILVFSIPAVQTYVADKATERINEDYGTDIQVESIQLLYNGQIELNQLYIGDHHNDTLISAKHIETGFANISNLISGESLDFGNVKAEEIHFFLKRYKGEETGNITIFSNKFQPKDKKEPKAFEITFDDILLKDSYFSIINENAEQPIVLELKDLDVTTKNLYIGNGKVETELEDLSTEMRRGLSVQSVSTHFLMNTEEILLDDLKFETSQSHILGDVIFAYDTMDDLGDFVDKVNITADFKLSMLSTNDLQNFYSGFGSDRVLFLDGLMEGNLNDFRFENLNLTGLDNTEIAGSLRIQNAVKNKGQNVKMSGDFNKLSTNYNDLINFLPPLRKSLPENLRDLGQVNLNGTLSADARQVKTNSVVSTDLGSASINGKLSDLNDPRFASYEGKLKINNFELGEVLGNSNLGTASFTVNLDGTGLSQDQLNSSLDGTIDKLEFNGYTYKNIEILGVLKSPIFNGRLIVNDPNLQMKFEGLADVSEEANRYNFRATVDSSNLHKLNFVDTDTIADFAGTVEMDVAGTNLNDMEGSIKLKNTVYRNQESTFKFEEFTVNSLIEGSKRQITVSSDDILSGEITGDYNLTQIPALFQNAFGSLYANYRPIDVEPYQYVDFEFDIYNKIISAFFQDYSIAPGTHLEGSVQARNSKLKFSLRSPEFKFYKNKLTDLDLEIDTENPLHNTTLNIDSIETRYYLATDFNMINNTANDTLFIRTEFDGGSQKEDHFDLSFFHTIDPNNNSVVGVRKSSLTFKDSKWFLNKDNSKNQTAVFDNRLRNFTFDSLTMSHNDEHIGFSGKMRDTTSKDFRLDFDQVDLAKVTPSIDSLNLAGIIDGSLRLKQENGFNYPRSDLSINDLALNGIDYGKFNLNVSGNKSLTDYTIKAGLTGDNKTYLSANGKLQIDDEKPFIDLKVALNDFKIDAFSPFGMPVLNNLRGKVSGNANIIGNYSQPDIKGDLTLNDAGLKIPYLNVDLALAQNSSVGLRGQEFVFDKVGLSDTEFYTHGTLDGSISHTNFTDWQIDLNIDAPERLLVLNTDGNDESLYYGTGFIKGGGRIHGPTKELIIDVDAKTQEGTVFKIPLSDTELIGDTSFIYFFSPEEKKALKKGKKVNIKPVKGLELNFELDVTPDAEVEIVVDQESGSSLRGQGVGTLLMEINTGGKFNMWGDFLVTEGVYDFKYYGVVEKEFEVVSGGSINWQGSPTRANLDLRAKYQTEANPAILLENPTINRNIPVNVFIDINGELTNTKLDFDLEYPNLSSVVKSELDYRINDDENTELQALSLISQGSFFNQSGRNSGTSAIYGNLFERASGIFDDLFADENSKFKVGLNYSQGSRLPNQNRADRFGVTLSTQISKRIIINGKVGVPVGGVRTRSTVVGNLEINLLLNDSGTLRANLFNRESNIQYIGETLGYTQGVGLSYSVDFDTFNELIQKILDKEITVDDIPEKVKEKKAKKSVAPDYIEFPH
jgi:hypothetical protein